MIRRRAVGAGVAAEGSPIPTVVGIDVGGPRKGFDAVALRGTEIRAKCRSTHAAEIAAWCRSQGASVVAVDAPCRWRVPGGPGRQAERELARAGISCFPTPTRERAEGHAFFRWMVCGAELFAALEPAYPLHAGGPVTGPRCFETFPQAVACALAGRIVSAKEKRAVRTALLARAGIAVAGLARIDEIDATLCALAARHFADGTFQAYGDAAGGYLIVPAPAEFPSAGAGRD